MIGDIKLLIAYRSIRDYERARAAVTLRKGSIGLAVENKLTERWEVFRGIVFYLAMCELQEMLGALF